RPHWPLRRTALQPAIDEIKKCAELRRFPGSARRPPLGTQLGLAALDCIGARRVGDALGRIRRAPRPHVALVPNPEVKADFGYGHACHPSVRITLRMTGCSIERSMRVSVVKRTYEQYGSVGDCSVAALSRSRERRPCAPVRPCAVRRPPAAVRTAAMGG